MPETDTSSFTQVQKFKVLNALTWQRENNLFYRNIIQNDALLDECDKKFVLIGILSRVLQYNSTSNMRKGYVVELGINNFENDFYHSMSDVWLNNYVMLSDYLYTDIDIA